MFYEEKSELGLHVDRSKIQIIVCLQRLSYNYFVLNNFIVLHMSLVESQASSSAANSLFLRMYPLSKQSAKTINKLAIDVFEFAIDAGSS